MTTRLLGAIVLLLAIWPATTVRAQGTEGMFADPISTPQLMDYADRLGLSPQQRLAIESAHDVYKDEFRALRDGDVGAFLAEAGAMSGVMPGREEMLDFIERMEKLQGKIEKLDDHLFERFLPVLTEAQITKLPRVRLLRERQRHITTARQIASMSGGNIVDISELVHELDLQVNLSEIVDPVLATYERRLTTDLEKLSMSLFRLYLDVFDRLAAAGFEDVDFMDPDNDPEEMVRLQETMQQVFADLQDGIRESARDITEDERRTFRHVVDLLPTAERTSFRTAYYSAAYPSLRFALPAGDLAWMVRAIDDTDVPAETRDAIRPPVMAFLARLEWLTDEGVKLVDAQRGASSPFAHDRDAMRAHQEELHALMKQTEEAKATVEAALVEAVGEETLGEVRRIVGAIADTPPAPPEEVAELSEAEAQLAISTQDPFTAPPLTRREIREMAGELGLDDGGLAVLESLHKDYVAASMALGPRETLDEALRNQWQFDPATETTTPPTDRQIDEIAQLRRKCIEAIRAADDAFFEQVALVVDDEQRPLVERHRIRRQRAVYGRDGDMAGMMSGAAAPAVDLSALLAELDAAPEDEEAVASMLAAYENESVAALQARQSATLELLQATEKWTSRMQRAQADGDAMDWRDYQTTIGAKSKPIRAADEVIAGINERTLEAIRAQLSDETSRRLDRAYARHLHPDIFDDAYAVEEHITKALALESLSSSQRADLQELAASYRPAYEALCDRLVEESGPAPDWSNWDAETMREYQKSQSELAKLTYDRNELSHRAARRIRSVLDDSQLTMIGGLPAPADGP